MKYACNNCFGLGCIYCYPELIGKLKEENKELKLKLNQTATKD